MPPRNLALSALFVLVLAATLVPRLLFAASPTRADEARLMADLVPGLHQAGFAVHLAGGGDPYALAVKDKCRAIVRSADRADVTGSFLEQTGARYGPVSYGYRGQWRLSTPGKRPVIERMIQDRLARLHIFYGRPAVLAVSSSGSCVEIQRALGAPTIYATPP